MKHCIFSKIFHPYMHKVSHNHHRKKKMWCFLLYFETTKDPVPPRKWQDGWSIPEWARGNNFSHSLLRRKVFQIRHLWCYQRSKSFHSFIKKKSSYVHAVKSSLIKNSKCTNISKGPDCTSDIQQRA